MKQKTAEEIFARYWREYRVIRVMRWVGCAVCLAVLLPRVWQGDSLAAPVGICALYLLYLYGLRGVNSLHFLTLNLILNRDCDALKFTQVSRLLHERLGSRSTGMARLNIAQGLYWSGCFAEAEGELEQVRLKRNNHTAFLLQQNLRFNCAMQRHDLPAAQAEGETVRDFAEKQKHCSADYKNAEQVLLLAECAFAAEREDWENYRALQARLEEGYTTNLQKVSAAWNLAKADLAQGERENALARLHYAAEQGGTLYIAEEARRKFTELE